MKKFVEVNTPYSMIFKEVRRDVLGTPSTVKPENFKNRKVSNKWCHFYEDYGHLTDECISLKIRVDNHH